MMSSMTRSIWLAAALPLVIGCDEGKDRVAPLITIIQPAENTHFIVGDTITLSAKISDNELLDYVKAGLVNEDMIAVTPFAYRYPEGSEFLLDVEIILDDPGLEGGIYYLQVQADDGSNTSNSFLKTRISGADQELLGYLVITEVSFQETGIRKIDLAYETDSVFIIPHAYRHSSCGSREGQLYLLTAGPSRLMACNIFPFAIVWSVMGDPPAAEFYQVYADGLVFVSTGNGQITGRDRFGDIRFLTEPMEDYRAENFVASDEYVYAEMISPGGQQKAFHTYYRSTGSLRDALWINGDISTVLSFGSVAVAFENRDDGFAAWRYDPSADQATMLQFLPDRQIRNAIPYSDDEALVNLAGEIYFFDLENGSMSFLSGIDCDFLVYEPLADKLFAARGEELFLVSVPEGYTYLLEEFSSPILNFHCVYNR
jgi:hypothetical protein